MKTKIQSVFIILLLECLFSFYFICSKGENNTITNAKIESVKKICDTLKSGVNQNLNAIIFLSRYRGLIAGDHGIILVTTNGGYKWSKVGGQTGNKHLYGIAAADSETVIAVGESGTIIRSVNKGNNWSPVHSDNDKFLKSLRTVAFYDSTHGYVAGDSGVVFATSDAGIHWKKVYADPKLALYGFSFNSTGIPFVLGDNGTILKSKTWNKVASGTNRNLKSIHFAAGKTFWSHTNSGFAVGDKGTILRTTDGGNNWTVVPTQINTNLRSIYLTSSHSGYAVGENGLVLRFDGLKWTPAAIKTSRNLNAAGNVIPTTVCVGENGEILAYYPDSVKNGSSLNPQTDTCCQWTFNLNLIDTLEQTEGGEEIHYRHLEVCTSEGVDLTGGGTFTGWSVLENFHGRSEEFYKDPQRKNWEIKFLHLDSSIVTCYLMDQWGGPHTLNSYLCTVVKN